MRTVHTQLARALVQLRGRLERLHGGSADAWLPILGLLTGAERSGGWIGTTLGAVLMDMKVKLAVGACALAGLTLVARPLWQAPAAEVASPPSAPGERGPIAPERAAEFSPEPVPIASAPREAAVFGEELTPESAPTAALLAQVIDTSGTPVAGIAVRCAGTHDPEAELRRSDAAGRLELPCEGGDADVEVLDERWVLVRAPFLWRRGAGELNLLMVAPRVTLAGRVVDARGEPLPGVLLRVFQPWFEHGDVPAGLAPTRALAWTTHSDAGGAFRLEAGVLPGGRLVARRSGFQPDLRAQPTWTTLDLRIELAELEPGAELLVGHVVDERGAPVEGARVALGFEHASSDAAGRFLIRATDDDKVGVLTALEPGSLPARLQRAAASSTDPAAWPDPLILRLGGPPLAIRGRVLDARGEPVAGAQVRVLDPTHFGAVEWGDVEGITTLGTVESLLAERSDRPETQTDVRGEFELAGLLPRAYQLSATDAPRMGYVESGPIEAGAQRVVLRLPAQELRPTVAGRVLSLSGEPIAGASIVLVGGSLATPRDHGDGVPFREPLFGASQRTDGEGRFRFEGVATSVTSLQVHGAEISFGNDFPLPAGADLGELEVRVPRSCKLKLDFAESDLEADSAVLLDAAGERLRLTQHAGSMLWVGEEASFGKGRSLVVSAGETARTLVIRCGAAEVLRLPVTLVPGELTVVRP